MLPAGAVRAKPAARMISSATFKMIGLHICTYMYKAHFFILCWFGHLVGQYGMWPHGSRWNIRIWCLHDTQSSCCDQMQCSPWPTRQTSLRCRQHYKCALMHDCSSVSFCFSCCHTDLLELVLCAHCAPTVRMQWYGPTSTNWIQIESHVHLGVLP